MRKEDIILELLAYLLVFLFYTFFPTKKPKKKNSFASYPTIGIKLSYLNDFINICGGRKAFEGLKTEDVKYNFILPLTSKKKTSFCDMLKDVNQGNQIGEANVFISHAWQCNFLEIVDIILEYFREESKSNEIIIWFDIFSVNQNTTIKNFTV